MRRCPVDPARQKLLRIQRQLEQESICPIPQLPLQRQVACPPPSGRSSDPIGKSSRSSALPPRSARSTSSDCRQHRESRQCAGDRFDVSAPSTPRSSLRATSEGPVVRSPRHVVAIAHANALMNVDDIGTGTSSGSNAKVSDKQVPTSEDFAIFVSDDGSLRCLDGASGSDEAAPVFIACNGDGATIFSLTASGKVRTSSLLNPHEPPRILPIRVAISQLALGSAHAAMISNDGCLFEARGQQPHRWALKPLAKGRCFTSIACGDAHTLAVALALGSRPNNGQRSSGGEVFSWGEGRAGQLGLGRPLRNFPEPTPIRGMWSACDLIACGMHHSLVALSGSDELFSFGWSEHGRLGPDAFSIQESKEALEEGCVREAPSQVALPGGCCLHLIAAGAQHSVIATTSGELFSFGSNEFGQLGMRDAGLWSCKLVRLTLPAQARCELVQLSCSSTSTLAVTSSGEVHSWGAISCNDLSGRGKFRYRVEGAAVAGDLVGLLVRFGAKSASEIVSRVAQRQAERERQFQRDKAKAEAEAEECQRSREEESQRKAEEAVRRAEEEARLRFTDESCRRREEEARRELEEEEARMQAERERLEEQTREASQLLEEQARIAKEAESEKQRIQDDIRRAEQALLWKAEEAMSNDLREQVEEVEEEEVQYESLHEDSENEHGNEEPVTKEPKDVLHEAVPGPTTSSSSLPFTNQVQPELDDDDDDVQEAIDVEPDELEDVQEVIASDGDEPDNESRRQSAQCKLDMVPHAPLLPHGFAGNHGDHSEERARCRRDRKNNGALFQPVLEARRVGDSRSLSARGKLHGKSFQIPLVTSAREVSC